MSARVGLFGGTFDPVHNGHISIARSFLASGLIDEIWILLTPYPPHKTGADHSGYTLRLKMLEAAFRDIEHVSISTIEEQLPKPSYSIQTIRHLKEEYPDTTFYFCMGEDSLSQFHTWKDHHQIVEECELLVAQRPGETHKNVDKEILAQSHFVDHEPLDIASSEIREKVKSGRSVSDEVPESVLKIIEKERLYS